MAQGVATCEGFPSSTYCLSGCTTQLLANYGDVPQNLIEAIVDSNRTRKEQRVRRGAQACERARVLRREGARGRGVPPHHEDRLGQLPHELGAGHTRRVKAKGVPVAACEPTLDAPDFFGSEVTHDLEAFKGECDVIIANRWSEELSDVAGKVYTRDLFKRD